MLGATSDGPASQPPPSPITFLSGPGNPQAGPTPTLWTRKEGFSRNTALGPRGGWGNYQNRSLAQTGALACSVDSDSEQKLS